MNIQDLIKYQDIELNILSIERKLNETEQYKIYAQYEKEKKLSMHAVQSLDKEAEKLIKEVSNLDVDIKETAAKISAIKQEINSSNDLAKLDILERNLIEYSRLLQKDNKDLSLINARLKVILNDAQKSVEKYKEVAAKEKDVLAELKEIKKTLDIEIEPLKVELSKVREKLLDYAIELYENAKRHNKLNLITVKDKGYCTACGQDVELEIGKKIEEYGIAECPRCFRVLYVEDK